MHFELKRVNLMRRMCLKAFLLEIFFVEVFFFLSVFGRIAYQVFSHKTL